MIKRQTYGIATLFFLCTAVIGILLFVLLRPERATPTASSLTDSTAQAGPTPEPNQPVTISADGRTCTLIVHSSAAYGLNAIDASTGRKFVIQTGEQIEITASGTVQIGTDRPVVGPDGETTGYWDTSVDSPFFRNVGGLEMWIGNDRRTSRYFIGSHFSQKIHEAGVPTFRVIESIPGYSDGNFGAFTVVLKKR